MSIFGGGGGSKPTRLNEIRVNQSVLGYALPVIMGRGRIQQSLIWQNGFTSKKESAGGKGGGKGATFYNYFVNCIAALCNGVVKGIGDVWAGQSWLSNSASTQAATIPSAGIVTPDSATMFAVDAGVGVLNSFSSSHNDLGAPSATVLSGSDLGWNIVSGPIASISTSGVATTGPVYANTAATVRGYYWGASNTLALLVLDSNPDNYGSYAGDGIPDSWQVQYFGTNNPEGVATADADGTGQNNLFKYVAGLDPTNPASIFVLKIAAVNGQPSQKNLLYNPIAGGRTYTVEFRTNLVSGNYAALSGFSGPVTNVNQVTVTDQSATNQTRFYRIDISLP